MIFVFLHRTSGQSHNGCAAPILSPADLACRVDPIHHRHLAVHQDEQVVGCRDAIQGFLTILCAIGLVAQLLDQSHRYQLIDCVVLDNQDAAAWRFRGN